MDFEDRSPTSRRLTVIRSLIVLGLIAIAVIVIVPTVIENVIPVEVVDVECVIGSEKSGFLGNEQVQEILAKDYGLNVSFRRMGSIEQAYVEPAGVDCLWPSNTSAVEIFQELNSDLFANGSAKSEIIFNSPIVVYAWKPITDAMIDNDLVTSTNARLETNTETLVNLLISEDKPTWTEFGVDDLFGSVNIITTDPTRSNSGNMFYALMANILVGDVATVSNIEAQLPAIKEFYDGQGRLEESSGILFEQFTSLGMGAYPAIANYESLLIELAINNPEEAQAITDQIQVIYPVPTVWSSHPIIALTSDGNQLLEALQDERFHKIAWEQHGFRSGLSSIQNDVSVFNIPGLADNVTQVIPLPRSEALLHMLEFLENN